MVFEDGTLREYDGGYDDWQRVRRARIAESAAESAERAAARPTQRRSSDTTSVPARQRLSYKEQQELAALPPRIEQLEQDIAQLHDAMAQPDFYRQDGARIASEQQRLQQLESSLAEAYERWESLEERA
jgi:ATP-binding cassette subfamily F protein uup